PSLFSYSPQHLIHLYFSFFFSMIPPPPTSTLFPYTTLFRLRKMAMLRRPPTSSSQGSGLRSPVQQTASAMPHRSSTRSSPRISRSEEHTSELQSRGQLVCRLLLEKKKKR